MRNNSKTTIFLILIIFIGINPSALSPAAGQTASGDESGYEYDYHLAYNMYEAGDYRLAKSMFEALLKRSVNHSLSDNCQYWIGECCYGLKEYKKAVVEFGKVFTFHRTNKAEDAQLKIGLCYIQLGDLESARRELVRLLSKYPHSESAGIGRRYLQKL